ncbi:MAG: peptide chain release factor 2 [Candidatus Dadabacteria bacterium]|nr:MAG: peptide chain release factor 2 [Candidatus Dadabacteria bacterium]
MPLGGFFDIPSKRKRFEELDRQAGQEAFWDNPEKAQSILKERSLIESWLKTADNLERLYHDTEAAFELAEESKDPELIDEMVNLLASLKKELEEKEFLCKMAGPFDEHDAILEINGGSGGTEAQDWAEMLLRMYTRWAERKGFELEELDYHAGEQAGIKSASILIKGPYAYGYLRSEQGVHRLVRISPFDSNKRRHTSFASVSVTPDIEEDLDVEIDEKDLRVDTYRASGAGGQHVNKTDSAVRLTHLPTGIVVACQNERSQHRNKERAMKLLKAKLFELEKQKQSEKLNSIKGELKKIEWGSQIRSYVMQPYQMVKDLRTGYETSSVNEVLDGELDQFIESFLLSPYNVAAG